MSSRGRAAAPAAALLLAASLLAASLPVRAAARAAGATAPTSIRVMEFNVEYGGERVDFDSVPRAIEAVGADIVAVEEGYANIPRIAQALGWAFFDERTQVLSRFPLLSAPGGQPLDYVEVAPGRVMAIANVHLSSTSYGPFQVRDGATAAEVLAIERHKRLPEIEPVLAALAPLVDAGVPVVLAGDFNAPSHRDWTAETVGIREHVRYPLAWPVSRAVEGAGLVDSYRAVHPDPVADPGLTWPADRPFVPGYNPFDRGAPADRIDFVYAGGPARAIASRVVGEAGSPGVDVVVSPWPTDHRAVVSTFTIDPAPEPTIVSVDHRLSSVGDEVTIRSHADDGGSVAVVEAGADAGDDVIAQVPLGASTIATAGWRPGAYEAVLRAPSGEERARAAFWLRRPGAEPRLRTDRSRYRAGHPIRVSWRLAPGNRFDWIGIYRHGADPDVASYLLWGYTGARVEGELVLDRDASGAWPLRPGRYDAVLLLDDSYVDVAVAPFRVRPAS